MPTKLTRKEVITSDDKYRARPLEEIEGNGISIINEPIPPENVRTLVRPRQRSLHAVLCEADQYAGAAGAVGGGRAIELKQKALLTNSGEI